MAPMVIANGANGDGVHHWRHQGYPPLATMDRHLFHFLSPLAPMAPMVRCPKRYDPFTNKCLYFLPEKAVKIKIYIILCFKVLALNWKYDNNVCYQFSPVPSAAHSAPYHFEAVHSIVIPLLHLHAFDEETLYEMSLEIEHKKPK